jgi:CelD/BcsL family acetyltransferase involved in cellulose biosynthesis
MVTEKTVLCDSQRSCRFGSKHLHPDRASALGGYKADPSPVFEIVKEEARFLEIGAEWHRLWLETDSGVFQAYAWVLSWWQNCHKHRYRLRIGLAWHGDQLVAIIPLVIRSWRGIRLLEWAAQMFSDYCDAIMHSSLELGSLTALWESLYGDSNFDIMRLKHVRPDAKLQPVLQRVSSLIDQREVGLKVVSRWSNGAEWFRTLNKSTRNDYRRGKRILDAFGRITIHESVQCDDDWLTHVINLKRLWLSRSPNALVEDYTTLPAFVRALGEIGRLRIFQILCNDQVIAASINAVHKNRMMAWFATYDPAYRRASPGVILMTEYTHWALDRGFTEIDYMLGDEQYKYKFANAMTQLATFMCSKSIWGAGALSAYRLSFHHNGGAKQLALGSAYLTKSGQSRT